MCRDELCTAADLTPRLRNLCRARQRYPQAGFVWAMAAAKAVEELALACRRGQPGLNCPCRSVSSRPTVLSSPGGADDATAWSSRADAPAAASTAASSSCADAEPGDARAEIRRDFSAVLRRQSARWPVEEFASSSPTRGPTLERLGGPLPLPMLVNVHNRRAGQIVSA
uniref:Protein Wnt n=1 Tax=Macrostomum lignano TaxID=282301 RepID=A0A1I8FGB9_9PLAT